MTARKTSKNAFIPGECDKPDTSRNGEVEILVERHRELEKTLLPLRINKTTVIYVKPEKCNEQYASYFRNKIERKIIMPPSH